VLGKILFVRDGDCLLHLGRHTHQSGNKISARFGVPIINKRIAKQTWKFVRGKVGDTIKEDIAPEMVGVQKLNDDQIFAVADIGKNIEIHYDRPMDIEWCIEDGQIFVVQARPVTTLSSNGDKAGKKDTMAEEIKSEKILVKGLAASPGTASGRVRHVADEMNLEVIKKGDIMVTKMTTPDMVPAMTRAALNRAPRSPANAIREHSQRPSRWRCARRDSPFIPKYRKPFTSSKRISNGRKSACALD